MKKTVSLLLLLCLLAGLVPMTALAHEIGGQPMGMAVLPEPLEEPAAEAVAEEPAEPIAPETEPVEEALPAAEAVEEPPVPQEPAPAAEEPAPAAEELEEVTELPGTDGETDEEETPAAPLYRIEGDFLIVYAEEGSASAIPDYDSYEETPWAEETFFNVRIDEGITSIGTNAFSGITDNAPEMNYRENPFRTITLPESLTSIASGAFPAVGNGVLYVEIPYAGRGPQYGIELYYRGTEEQWKNVTNASGVTPACYSATGAAVSKLEVISCPEVSFELGTGEWRDGGYYAYNIMNALRESEGELKLKIHFADGLSYEWSVETSGYGMARFQGFWLSVKDDQQTEPWTEEGTYSYQFELDGTGTRTAVSEDECVATLTANSVQSLEILSVSDYEYIVGEGYDVGKALEGVVLCITYANGETHTVTLSQTNEGSMLGPVSGGGNIDGYPYRFETDTSQWAVGSGETVEANNIVLYWHGHSVTIPVTVIENPVKSISISKNCTPFVYKEYENGSYRPTWDDDGNAVAVFTYDLNPWLESLTIVVTYTDGTTKEFPVTVDNGFWLGDYRLECRDDQELMSNPWTVGSDNRVILTYLGARCEACVTVEENDVADFTVDTDGFYFVEGQDCYWAFYYDEDTQEVGRRQVYAARGLASRMSLEVTYDDGTEKTVGVSESSLHGEEDNPVSGVGLYVLDSDGDYNSSFTLYVTYAGITKAFTVPVKSTEESGVTLSLKDDGHSFYLGVHCIYPYGAELTITYPDGSEETVIFDENMEYWMTDTVGGWLINGHYADIEYSEAKASGEEVTGYITYMGVREPFSYRVYRGELSDQDGIDMGIESIVCTKPTENGLGSTFTVNYDNGLSYSFTPESILKTRDLLWSQNGAVNTRYQTVIDGELADLNLSVYKTTEDEIYSVWMAACSFDASFWAAGYQKEIFEVYHAGLNADVTVTESGSSATVGGIFVDTSDANINDDESVENSDTTVYIDVSSDADDVSDTSVAMETEAVDSLAETGKTVSITTDVATVSFDSEVMEELSEQTDGVVTLALSLTEELPETIESAVEESTAVLLEVNVTADGTELLADDGSSRGIVLTIPVPECLAEAEAIYVYYWADDGSLSEVLAEVTEIDGVKYVVVQTDHFSKYILTEKDLPLPETDSGEGDEDADSGDGSTGNSTGGGIAATGDKAQPVLWMLVLLTGIGAVALLAGRKRRQD